MNKMEWTIKNRHYGGVMYLLHLCGCTISVIYEPTGCDTFDMLYEARNNYEIARMFTTLEEAKKWVEHEALNPPEKDTSKYGGFKEKIRHHRELVARFKG